MTKIINVRGGEWSFKSSGSRKILVQFHGSRFLAVMCVSQSRFFYKAVSESRFFARLRVSKSQFVPLSVFINDVFRLHLMLNFNEATYKFSERNLILTSPKLS